jgi:tetratricopeptide (TPR) repeat protein
MRTTSSFEIFPNDASERELAKARWLRREGRLREAEAVYRRVMARQPGLRTSWTECFDLLRRSGRTKEAFALAVDAERAFATDAFPIALKGAALAEQHRFPEALQALETAVERDPGLALTWHELGYAAYRLGDGTRALLALDRAFALEPHTETLILRGRILREAGELYAATVAFEAALHSATHEEQYAEIEHELLVTQRLGDFAPRRLRDLTRAERWFAEHGTVVIAAADRPSAPTTEAVAEAFVNLARDRHWEFRQVVAPAHDDVSRMVAQHLGVACEPLASLDLSRTPLVVAHRSPTEHPAWNEAVHRVHDGGRGAVFVAWHPIDVAPDADVVGALEDGGAALPLSVDAAQAVVMAQHPGARIADRQLARPVSAV